MVKYGIRSEAGKLQYVETANMEFVIGRTIDDRKTRGIKLYITKQSRRFFLEEWSQWEGETTTLTELDENDAREMIEEHDDMEEVFEACERLNLPVPTEIE